jgi:hypothetical protein
MGRTFEENSFWITIANLRKFADAWRAAIGMGSAAEAAMDTILTFDEASVSAPNVARWCEAVGHLATLPKRDALAKAWNNTGTVGSNLRKKLTHSTSTFARDAGYLADLSAALDSSRAMSLPSGETLLEGIRTKSKVYDDISNIHKAYVTLTTKPSDDFRNRNEGSLNMLQTFLQRSASHQCALALENEVDKLLASDEVAKGVFAIASGHVEAGSSEIKNVFTLLSQKSSISHKTVTNTYNQVWPVLFLAPEASLLAKLPEAMFTVVRKLNGLGEKAFEHL